ncbi:MauE/DoxX family redox-associated membrane protein [Nonomuraea angiospora]|uniref:MauE/DoxX family redox-associated membrane protein n=1 Tax=Nonomuraea angiospora TaxID=46172 RepID=UPI003794861A
MLLAIIREVAGCYLVVTLTATGLAKLRSWRRASTSVTLEGIIPRRMALPIIIAVSTTELTLATLFVTGWYPVVVGYVTACVFLSFGAYKIVVAARTGNVPCSCSGTSRAYRATRPDILGAVAASLIQASLACAWAFMPESGEMLFRLPLLIAFTAPIAVFLVGRYLHRERPTSASSGPKYSLL